MKFPKQFIAATKEYNTLEKYIPLYYFRKSFQIEKEVSFAQLTIGSLGYYELHINGANITKGEMAPYRSNPDHYVYYDQYEVSLQKGKNAIGILLGNGLQSSVVPKYWEFERLPWRSAPAVSFALEIQYADGSEERIESDSTTLVAPSPILFNDLHFGEYYDAQLEIPGWDLPDFDAYSWQPALPVKEPRGSKRICEADPIRIIREEKPISLYECDGGWIYDFGTNDTGLCRLSIHGEKGQKLVLKYFEHMKDGQPDLLNIRFRKTEMRFQEDEYTCAGGKVEHTPRFTYHGFQYVWVFGLTKEQATKALLTRLIIHSDVESRGSFSCDNEMINRLQDATVRSDYSNFHYFPTDCPHREKNGWTADASLSAEQFFMNLAPERNYKEWLRNIYKAMKPSGQLPGIIPTGGWGYDWGNGPAWDNVILWLPYFTYRYRGDREILQEAALPILRYLSYLYSKLDERDLLAIGLGDWCEAGENRADGFSTPLVVTDSILAMDIAKKAAFIYKELSMPEYEAFAQGLAKRLTAGICTHLIDHEAAIMEGDTQSGQAMGLFYGLFTKEEQPKALERLIQLIEKFDGHMKVGVLGGRCIFRVLADHGYGDLALNMIVRPDFPSYGYWITCGATTLREDFRPNGNVSSLNHHFWGDISAWFYRYLAGMEINPDATDICKVNIKPVFASVVNHVKASHRLPYGELSVEWTRKGDTIILDVEVPAMARGEIHLPEGLAFPDGSSSIPLKSGTYTIK